MPKWSEVYNFVGIRNAVNPTRIAKWGVILLWPSIFFSFNRPLPSSKNPHFQNEAKSTIFLVKMSFICMRMKNHFHNKGWALNLVLIQRPEETWNWHIGLDVCSYLATRQGVNKTATIMARLFLQLGTITYSKWPSSLI